MTMPTSTPSARISAISAAILEVTFGSMPNWCSPISASPDNFNRMRLYVGGGGMARKNYSPSDAGSRVEGSDKESEEESSSERRRTSRRVAAESASHAPGTP